jgi:ABC-type nitrate/sulfonate/bicarbonate transport system substrate-binding protein
MMLFSSFSLEGVSAQDKVRIGVTNPNMVFLNARIALVKGFFQEEGIQAEVIRMNPSVMITAAGTGDLDYPLVFGSVVRAAIRGLPLRITSNFMNGPLHVLVARSEFKTIQDLKGRTIGIDSHGATSEVTGRMIYKHFGMELEKDSKVIALGSAAARLSALKQNLVHGIIVTPPGDAEAERMGFRVIARGFDLFSMPQAGMGTHLRKIQTKPSEVKSVLKALIKASRYIRDNRDGAVAALVEWGRVAPELAAATYDSTFKAVTQDGGIPENGLRLVIDQARNELKLSREIAPTEVADMSLLQQAQKELGLR